MRWFTTNTLLGVSLALALACGGGGGGSGSGSTAATPEPAAPAAPVEPPKAPLVDTKWDLSWTDRSASVDHILLNADGTVTDLSSGKNKGPWKLDGKKFALTWADWVVYEGELSDDGTLIQGTWKKTEGKDKGTWKAVPSTYTKAEKKASASTSSSGSGRPSCNDLKRKCKEKSDARGRDCWSSCSGNYSCQDACNETNRKERVDCEYQSNCD